MHLRSHDLALDDFPHGHDLIELILLGLALKFQFQFHWFWELLYQLHRSQRFHDYFLLSRVLQERISPLDLLHLIVDYGVIKHQRVHPEKKTFKKKKSVVSLLTFVRLLMLILES